MVERAAADKVSPGRKKKRGKEKKGESLKSGGVRRKSGGAT